MCPVPAPLQDEDPAAPAYLPDLLFGITHQLLLYTISKDPQDPRALDLSHCLLATLSSQSHALAPEATLPSLRAIARLFASPLPSAPRTPLLQAAVALLRAASARSGTQPPPLLLVTFFDLLEAACPAFGPGLASGAGAGPDAHATPPDPAAPAMPPPALAALLSALCHAAEAHAGSDAGLLYLKALLRCACATVAPACPADVSRAAAVPLFTALASTAGAAEAWGAEGGEAWAAAARHLLATAQGLTEMGCRVVLYAYAALGSAQSEGLWRPEIVRTLAALLQNGGCGREALVQVLSLYVRCVHARAHVSAIPFECLCPCRCLYLCQAVARVWAWA